MCGGIMIKIGSYNLQADVTTGGRHGCVEDVDGEAIRAVAVVGAMFGGSIKYVVDLHLASLTPVRSHSTIVSAELRPSSMLLESS